MGHIPMEVSTEVLRDFEFDFSTHHKHTMCMHRADEKERILMSPEGVSRAAVTSKMRGTGAEKIEDSGGRSWQVQDMHALQV